MLTLVEEMLMHFYENEKKDIFSVCVSFEATHLVEQLVLYAILTTVAEGACLLESDNTLTMLESMICPFPDFVLSSSARTIPRAQVRPPPAKSANRFRGA